MKNTKGFTLIELLIASSITLVIMAAVYFSFSAGIFGYRDIEGNLMVSQEARLILGRLGQELRNSVFYKGGKLAFRGGKDNISFPAVLDSFLSEKRTQNLALVTYRFEKNKIARQSVMNGDVLDENISPAEEDGASNIDNLSFTYGYLIGKGGSIEWRDTWDDLELLPVAVKINLTIRDKIKNYFSQTIYLPLAKLNEKL